MKIHDVRQGSSEWLSLRLGIPTASEFDNLITPEWKLRTGQTPQTYLYQKLTEKCMGCPIGMAGSFHMEQGSILENEAIPFYSFTYDVEIKRVGFVTTDYGRIGCSPDGLIGDEGGIEVKCPAPETHLKYLLEGELPAQYRAQVHGSMLVTGRPWWIFMSYSRQFPPFILKVERDEKIQESLNFALEAFLMKFDAAMTRIQAFKEADNAKHT